MAVQFSVAVREAQVVSIQTTIQNAGTTGMLINLYNGTEPGSCGASLSGNTLLAQGTLPSPFLSNSGGTATIVGTYTLIGQSAAGGGTSCTFFRVIDQGGTCQMQGTAGSTGTDLVLSNPSISSGQTITVSGFTLIEGNA